jgi:cell wall-associated NlpC family hydrolase
VVLPPGVQVAQFAAGYLGTPYVAGGETPRGWDCSGMMRWVYAQFGVYLSRVTTTQVREGLRVDPGDLLPGDLLFYNTLPPNPGHVGMYLGNGQMVNALNERAGTVISDIWDSYWAPRFYGARRAI